MSHRISKMMTKNRFRSYLTIMSLILLSFLTNSCGEMRPLYALSSSGGKDLDMFFKDISLPPPKERLIREIHIALRTHWNMDMSASPIYRLNIDVTNSSFDSFVKKNTDITRQSHSFDADFTLENIANASVVFSGHAFAIISHDVTEAEFSNIHAREDAFSRGAYQLSEDIRLRLASWFSERE